MEVKPKRIPPGPQQPFRATEDLLEWMGRQFAAFGDTYKAAVYGTTAFATRDLEFTYHVLVENWQNYVKGQMIDRVALLLGKGLMVSEGELWRRQRRMIQPAFTQESIGTLAKLMTSVNLGVLSKWQGAARKNEGVNVTRDVSGMAIEIVLRFILGEDYQRVGFHFDLLSDETARDMAFARTFRALGKIVQEVMDRRRKDGVTSTDGLGLLMQARNPTTGAPMSDQQVIDEFLTLIVAGHETTASTLNWTWYLLSQHPEVEQKLFSELDAGAFSDFADLSKFPYTRQIVEEAMRLYPAGWLVTRKAVRDDWLGEYFVPAGTEIYIPPYFIQRHPNLWEEPDAFDPDRFRSENVKNRHKLASIPFSSGPRNCIGSHFARAEMQIHLLTIARHLRLRFTPSKPIEMEAGVNLRSKYDFIMQPEVRVPGGVAVNATPSDSDSSRG